MSKESDKIRVNGVIEQATANGYFKVRLENDTLIMAHVSGKMRKNFIKILPGDKVAVEISTYDLEKGRIVLRY